MISPTPIVTIGETDGADEYLFQRIGAARLLPDGGVAVADRGRSAVRLYDAVGGFVRDIGRAGEGPGEFRYIGDLLIRAPDTLEIYDAMLYRLTTVKTSGEVLSTQSFSADTGFPEQYLGRFSNGDHALAWIRQGPRDQSASSADPMVFARFDAEGRQLAVLGEATGLHRQGRGPVPFTPQLHSVLADDFIFHTDGVRPEITVLSGLGQHVGTVPLPVEAGSAEEAWRVLEAELNRRNLTEELAMLPGISDRELLPAVSEMLLDEQGRFWLKRYEPSTDSHWLGGWAGAPGGRWDVVDREGAVLAQVEIPAGLTLIDVRSDRVVGMTRDELGVERIAVHSVTR